MGKHHRTAALVAGLALLATAPAPGAATAAAGPAPATVGETLAGELLATAPGDSSAALGIGPSGGVVGWSGPWFRRHDAVLWSEYEHRPPLIVGPPPAGFDARTASRGERFANAGVAAVAVHGDGRGPQAGFLWSDRLGTHGVVEGDHVRTLGVSGLGSAAVFLRRVGPATSAVFVDDAGGRRELTGVVVTSGGAGGEAGVLVAGYRWTGTPGDGLRAEPVTSDGTTTRALPVPAGRSGAVNAATGALCGETFDLVSETVNGVEVRRRTNRRPAVWRWDGLRFDLPGLGVESWCTAGGGGHDSRTSGVSAGQFRRADGTVGAVLWQRGKAYEIGPAGATSTVVAADPGGRAVGVVRGAGGVRVSSFVATAGAWRTLRVRGSTAVDVTDVGGWLVSGTLAGADGRSRAAMWRLPPRTGP
jgi:hypothetical protein